MEFTLEDPKTQCQWVQETLTKVTEELVSTVTEDQAGVNRIPPRSWTARDQYFEKLGGRDIAQEIENGKIKSEEMANGLTAEKHGSGSPSTMSITVEISVRVLKPNRKMIRRHTSHRDGNNVDLRNLFLSFPPDGC